ncbi:hypothetical protein JCM19233_5181 [Vibrio astriarenae]|nr:hypothetical protein JCM19233_5181 [Vibrio sp. C7]
MIEPTIRPDGSKANDSKGRAEKAKKKSKGKKVRQKKAGKPNPNSRGQK